jgi:2-haloacid dehalogenase
MTPNPAVTPSDLRALVFDVFGTVVDWRGSVIREGEELGRRLGVEADWGAFVDEWRLEGYYAAIARVRRGELPFMTTDELHRRYLDVLLPKHGLDALSPSEREHLVRAWHRLDPWPDSAAGLARLRTRYVVSTLSNGNLSLQLDLARHGHLEWDCLLSADLLGHFKPDPECYISAARFLDVEPPQLMLVASHKSDLQAAMACGLCTAFVIRPAEFGPGAAVDLTPGPAFDIVARDFDDLATQLGC